MDMQLASFGIDEVTLHHDLLIELGRVEMALELIQPDPNEQDQVEQDTPVNTQFQLLEGRRAKLNAMLCRLAA
jgi:hypothetical protein